MHVVGSHRHGPAGVVIGACVKCHARLWTTIASTMGRGNIACTYARTPRADPPLTTPTSATVRPSLFLSLDLDSWHGRPHGLPRRNMLARTSDTLGFGVCRAVPITPRRIPSACYLSLGTCAGDIMWESKRIRRYTRIARQTRRGVASKRRFRDESWQILRQIQSAHRQDWVEHCFCTIIFIRVK